MNIIENAIKLAVEAHSGQTRKYSGLPYIVHPLEVGSMVKNIEGMGEIEIAAAYLHDVIEDCPVLFHNQIQPVEVFELVKQLTNPSKGSNFPRAMRKRMDRDHLSMASQKAKIIKLCDRIANVNDFIRECKDNEFLNIYFNETRLLVEVLKGADKQLEDELLWLIGD